MVGSGHRHERIPPLLVGSRTGRIRPFFHPTRRPPVGRLRPSERIRGRALRSLSLRRAFFPGHAAVGSDREVRMMFHIPGLTTSVLLIAILSLSSSLAIGADDYPSRPIKLMVGASPGGTTDTMARAIAPPLASSLGRPVCHRLSFPHSFKQASAPRTPRSNRYSSPLTAAYLVTEKRSCSALRADSRCCSASSALRCASAWAAALALRSS